MKIYIRQSFTEAGPAEAKIIEGVFQKIISLGNDLGLNFDFLTGKKSLDRDNFKKSFETDTGLNFTPQNFRDYRLNLLSQTDIMIIIRTGLSESSAFELAYNIFKGKKVPVFFAIHEEAPLKTTQLRELQDLLPMITYFTFKDPGEISLPLKNFIHLILNSKLILNT